MPFDSAQGDPHAPAEGVPEPATPEPAVIETIAALTRDLAALHYERAQAERGGDTAEAASIMEAITKTKGEIAALTADPVVKQQFAQYRQEQFALVERVHDLQRVADSIEELRHREHTLSRQFSTRRPSSHIQARLRSSQQQQHRLQEEIDRALRSDQTLALAWRSGQLREYRRQLQKDHFVITPSRKRLMDRLQELLADERKVLLTGPTGTGKTELAKHTLQLFSGDPEILSGHQGLTSYDVYGKPVLTTSPDGATISSFHLGAFPRAAKDGRGLIIDELDLIPTQTLLRHKADWNLRAGDALRIQEDALTDIHIQHGFGVVATANIKGAKHKEREALDPAVTRLFEPLPVSYFPREELYDLTLATLIDRRGYLPLSQTDAAETLQHLVDAATDIQDAYLGRSTAFYEKGGRSTSKVASLEKAVLDPGRLLTLLSGFPRASLSGRSFQSFLNSELTHFVNNEDYSPRDRFTLLDILTTHGFLADQRIQDFLPSNFTPEEWQRHLQAHPPSLSAAERALSDKFSLPMLDPLQVAALDPYRQRAISASKAAEEFLTTPPPATTVHTVDITDIERTINLSSQYDAQLNVLRESAILQRLPSGHEGINGIDDIFHRVPTLPEIRSALSSQPHLREKITQGFTRLLLVPFSMSLDDLRAKYWETLLAVDQAGGCKDSQGNAVLLDRTNPLWTWEEYADADRTEKLLYGPKQFSQNHQGKTKADLLPQSPSGFQVLLVEDFTELPREGQGAIIGSRPQLECNRTSSDYLNTLHADPLYQHETGLIPEAYIALAITRLRESGTVLDKDTASFLTGAYFASSDNVPSACFDPGNHRAALSRDGAGDRYASDGVRVGVRVL